MTTLSNKYPRQPNTTAGNSSVRVYRNNCQSLPFCAIQIRKQDKIRVKE
jgi:hypothetical protein